jgi:3-oxoadipate enol-lactonase/4-carboxymuconolactone decarboxylase
MFSKYVDVGGVAVNYFHTGRSTLPGSLPELEQGELLLFVHGAGSNAHTWRRQIEHFGNGHSALALDLPAHGRSASTEGLATLREMVDCTLSFAAALKLRRFVFVGRAMGGAIGLELALGHPDRLRALVLVATPAHFEIPQASLDTWHDVSRGRKTQPFTTDLFSPKTDFAIMREAWMEQVKTDPRVRHTDLLACRGLDFAARLASVKVPTLVITGKDDRFAPPEKAAEVQQAIPGAKLAVIEDAGHTLSSEKPEEFNEAIDEFLAGLSKR